MTPLGFVMDGALPPIWERTGFFHFLSAMSVQPFFEVDREHRGFLDLPHAVPDQVVDIGQPFFVTDRREHRHRHRSSITRKSRAVATSPRRQAQLYQSETRAARDPAPPDCI